jgi:fibronectin type 3 domain-containing protein
MKTTKLSGPSAIVHLLALAISLTFVGGCRSKHSVALNWHPALESQGHKIVGYNIYRSTMQGGPYVLIASRVQGTNYEDDLITSGRVYYYVITSVDDAGRESRYSEETIATIP